MQNRKKIDKVFLTSVVLLLLSGFFIFISASWSLLAKDSVNLTTVAFKQIFLGIVLGSIAMVVMSKINYKLHRKWAFYILLFSIVITSLVFVDGFSIRHGGATRWLKLGPFSFQPSELLKIAFVVYFAAWLSAVKEKAATFKYGFLPFLILLTVIGAVLLKQPDTDTFIVILLSGVAMYIAASGKWRYITALAVGAVVGLLILASLPGYSYLMGRITTFLYPSQDPLGSSYQLQQSLIAVGSGGISGRGFGQSIQKFAYLPEPIGDSIFAVAAEEFGFIGSVLLIVLFLFFAFRGLKIAVRAGEPFGRLLAVGIVILVVASSFINIGSMLGVLPLSGLPLLFVSQGGTALFFVLAEVGIVLNVSKYKQI